MCYNQKEAAHSVLTVSSPTFHENLHEEMCIIAQDVVKNYWADVAVYDKRCLRRMSQDEYRLWVLRENGSYFFSLCCYLDSTRSSSKILQAFKAWLAEKDLDASTHYLENYGPESQRFFLVQKLENGSGRIAKVKYFDMVELVCGPEVRAALPDTMDTFYEVLDK